MVYAAWGRFWWDPRQQGLDFVDGVKHFDKIMLLEQVWGGLKEDLMQPYRWQRVKGPVAAAVATLLDCDWQPESLRQWIEQDTLLQGFTKWPRERAP